MDETISVAIKALLTVKAKDLLSFGSFKEILGPLTTGISLIFKSSNDAPLMLRIREITLSEKDTILPNMVMVAHYAESYILSPTQEILNETNMALLVKAWSFSLVLAVNCVANLWNVWSPMLAFILRHIIIDILASPTCTAILSSAHRVAPRQVWSASYGILNCLGMVLERPVLLFATEAQSDSWDCLIRDLRNRLAMQQQEPCILNACAYYLLRGVSGSSDLAILEDSIKHLSTALTTIIDSVQFQQQQENSPPDLLMLFNKLSGSQVQSGHWSHLMNLYALVCSRVCIPALDTDPKVHAVDSPMLIRSAHHIRVFVYLVMISPASSHAAVLPLLDLIKVLSIKYEVHTQGNIVAWKPWSLLVTTIDSFRNVLGSR